MKVEFTGPQEPWVECDQVIVARGDIPESEVVASVSVAVASVLVAQVDILASAGQSCFRSLRSIDSLVYIGFGQFVFIVDVYLRKVRRYPLNGYFAYLYDSGDLEHLDSHISVLATSASEVLAFDRTGDLIWKQSDLGIDGVVLQRADAGRIDGEGEWDPPGGWRPFSLSSKNGLCIR
jgi:hypothetical protein